MARCKHKGGQADGKKQHVLGVTSNLVDASTDNESKSLFSTCQMHKQCKEEQVSDTKSPSNIASRKRCSSKCSSRKKGEPLKHLLSRRKAKTIGKFYFSLFHQG
ncbi:hypothetical protein KY285_024000 [Solanum tuberosum]|nr:hypothetical protein KY285_024000 [Solanum tuberosum]